MVLAVIATVAALALIVSGYWLNSDFKVERNGMLQISSVPTGADVTIDGETSSWLQRTNTSKVLSSGDHEIILSKDGYDTWSRTINISEGLLYRVHYPRLFLQDRETENLFSVAGYTFATVSPNNEKILLVDNTTKWSLINLDNDTLKPEKIDISSYLSNTSIAEGAPVGLFDGQILSADWDRSNNHVLLQIKSDAGTEWVLLDVGNIKNSINLTREFGADFSTIEILDDSSSNLLAVRNGNLHKIDVPGKLISATIVAGIYDFDHYENDLVFSAHNNDAEDSEYTIGLTKIGDDKITKLDISSEPTKVAMLKFYDDVYIATVQGDHIVLHEKNDFTKTKDYQLTFTPEQIEVGHNGEFITMFTNNQIASLDMEANSVLEWSTDGHDFDWIDNDMIYSVSDGNLIVYDFDGLNRRPLSHNVSSHFPVTITNNKWLYYVSDDELVREWLIPR